VKWRKLIVCVVLASGLGGCGGSAPVAPPAPGLTSIVVSPANGSYQLPATQQFTATGKYSDGSSKNLTQSVTWSSSDASVATIDNSAGNQGKATMVGSGSADITAAMASIQSSTTVTVSSTVGVSVSPTFASVTVTHQTQAFSAAVQGTTNTAVTWSVDGMAGGNSTLGTISNSGVYTPPSTGGYHTIAAASQADLGKTATAQVAVMYVPGVFTRQYDNARTGQNTDEIVLTPQNVNVQRFGKLVSYPVDGIIFAQPIYVANVMLPDNSHHNIVYVATTNDTVYAIDADSPSVGIIWQKSLADTAQGETAVPCADESACTLLGADVGIIGTPAIAPATGTLYVDAASEINGNYYHKLHALDIATGDEKFGGPVTIQGSVPGVGEGGDGTTVTFDPHQHLQRPGLLFANGNVYIGFASYNDTRPYHGWIFAYDANTLQQVNIFNDTPDGYTGGIWQGAGGIAADASGNIYFVTGNGDFNADTGGRDYGDSIIKLSPTLSMEDFFTPYNQNDLNIYDMDLGSSSPLLLPDQSGPNLHLLVADGKGGEIYVVNRDNMGHFHAADNSQIVQSMPGATAMVLAVPAYWDGHVYYQDLNYVLRMFGLSNGQISATPQYQLTNTWAQGMAVSANGSQAGILWAIQVGAGGGRLEAYDATNLSELYDSKQDAARDSTTNAVPFQAPVVVNGKVFVGAQYQIDIYGLLPQ
jgi:Bacterial Ig-like domain (group 2)